jgi:uncharacterized membrane protein HdeD (DUF308 family)
MDQKSRLYIGIFTIAAGIVLIIYALTAESTYEHPVKDKEILIGAPLLILLGVYRVHTYYRSIRKGK